MSEYLPCSYQEMGDELSSLGCDMNASEMHALMSAWLCLHDPGDESWWHQLFPDMKVTYLMRQVFMTIADQLSSDEFVYELLLPEDDVELSERGVALADWCSAFLSGVGLSKSKKIFSAELQEGLEDLVEITKLDYASLESAEENEASLMEINEFVKTVVMMTYWEMKEKRGMDSLH